MRSKIFQEVLNETPKEVEIFIRLYSDLVVRINDILQDKQMTKADLARSLNKRPSEIHKWLSGNHNLTLQSIAKLQAELGESLLEISSNAPKKSFQNGYVCTEYKVITYSKVKKREDSGKLIWLSACTNNQKISTNVG